MDFSKIIARGTQIVSATSIKSLELILSGPCAEKGLSFFSLAEIFKCSNCIFSKFKMSSCIGDKYGIFSKSSL